MPETTSSEHEPLVQAISSRFRCVNLPSQSHAESGRCVVGIRDRSLFVDIAQALGRICA